MENKTIYFAIFFILILSISLYMLSNVNLKTACRKEKSALQVEMNRWVLVKVYRDSENHNNETIEYLFNYTVRKSLIFNGEINLIFDQLKEGDILNKEKNNLEVVVNKDSENKVFFLNYGCK